MKTICTGMFTIMLVLLFRPVGAQTEDAFPSYIEQCFNNYFNFNPQEKIYLHTDKPTYSAGENIWFRAYCVDGCKITKKIFSSKKIYRSSVQ